MIKRHWYEPILIALFIALGVSFILACAYGAQACVVDTGRQIVKP